jgi:hypothetical protein
VAVFADAGRRARFREYRSQLSALAKERGGQLRIAHPALVGDVQPEFGFVGFFEDDS